VGGKGSEVKEPGRNGGSVIIISTTTFLLPIQKTRKEGTWSRKERERPQSTKLIYCNTLRSFYSVFPFPLNLPRLIKD